VCRGEKRTWYTLFSKQCIHNKAFGVQVLSAILTRTQSTHAMLDLSTPPVLPSICKQANSREKFRSLPEFNIATFLGKYQLRLEPVDRIVRTADSWEAKLKTCEEKRRV